MNTTERADKAVMGVSPTRLPRLLVVVVMAFAPFEARPLLGAAELFPGMAMQLAYGWATGRVIADPSDKAVLLWSVASRRGAHPSIWRELFGGVAALSAALVLVIVTNAILLLPLRIALVAAGVSTKVILAVMVSFVGVRLMLTLWRALRAYRSDRGLLARLPSSSSPPVVH